MVAQLNDWADGPSLDPEFALEPWDRRWLRPLAEILVRAYTGMPEIRFYPELSATARCLRWLQQRINDETAPIQPEASALLRQGTVPVGGILAARTGPDTGSIEHIAVLPEYRRRGLGKALLEWSLRQLRDRGARRVELHVTADNLPAIRLYTDRGFSRLGVYEVREPDRY